MLLFDQIIRTETRWQRYNESRFDYLNSSAKPHIVAIRDLLEKWFSFLPDNAKTDIQCRFRKHNQVPHESSCYELFWHQLLRVSGYEVEVHPKLPDVSKNPDFLAKRKGIPRFFLEATIATQPHDAQTDPRLAELHDTLNRTDSPDYFLDIEYRGSPTRSIRGRTVRSHLEQWLRQLDFDEIYQLHHREDRLLVPRFIWEGHGLLLSARPIPKGPEFRGKPGVRPVVAMDEAEFEFRELHTDDDIRAALEGKAGKYGKMNLPFVVAINVLDDFCDEDDIENALFRDSNNVWLGRYGPRNLLVSAVVVTHQLTPYNLHTCKVEMIHNPWAAHPLPQDYLSLTQIIVSRQNGSTHRIEGRSAASLLGLLTT